MNNYASSNLVSCDNCGTIQRDDCGDVLQTCWHCHRGPLAYVVSPPAIDDLRRLADQLREAVERYDEADRQVSLLSKRNVQLHAEYGRLLGRSPRRAMHRDYWIGCGTCMVGVAIFYALHVWGIW